MPFTIEKDFEDALIKRLTELPNQWSPDILEYKTEQELINNWADFLNQNNNLPDRLNNCPLTDGEMRQVLAKLNSTPYETNKLLSGNLIPITRDNPDDLQHLGKTIYLFIFDKDKIGGGNSKYQIARQPRFTTDSEILGNRRGDLMLLINGMPLIHIELKASNHHVSDACNQIEKYMKLGVFTGFFSLVQMFVAMTPEETVYFANPGRLGTFNPDYQFHWADFNNTPINDWEDIARNFLSIPMAHQMIGYGTVADGADNTLKIMRSYQYYAAIKVYARAIDENVWDAHTQEGGYVYHTTGSGKTLTSFKCAQLIASSKKVDKIVFLMDRTELWKQTFIKYRGFAVSEQVDDVTSTRDLIVKLCSGTGPEDDSSQLIVASIQKMSRITIENGANPLDVQKIQKKRIVFIIDEAHQDVAGEMLAGIKRTYKNALFFGFTGTPIMPENAINGITTQGLFGECLHSYNILNGIRDKNVLGFKTFKISTFDENELKEIVSKQKSGVTDVAAASDEQFATYRKWKQKSMLEIEKELDRSIYREGESGKKHRQAVADSILKNWDIQSNRGQFHQILATSSISEAIEYYDLFASNDKGLFVTAIFDPSTDLSEGDTWKEDAIARILTDYNNRFGFRYNLASYKNFKDDVCSRLAHIEPYKSLDINRADAVNIVIVVNQLLTGFDSKWINVLNLDKVLIYQKYIQAASRTNRLFRQDLKPYGIIKYYRVPHLQEELANEALRLYIESDEYKYVFASSLGYNIITINECFKDIKTLFTRIGVPNFDKIPRDEADQRAFANAFSEMASAVSRAIPELFNWAQTTYKTEDCGDVSVNIDELTFEILRKRYSELSREQVVDPANIYEIKTYLVEQENNIDLAFLEANFQAFYKDLSNNATPQEIEKVLLELRTKFAVLSVDEQRIAEIILSDIQSGEFDYQDNKGFMDYILEYSQRELYQNIAMYAKEFGVDKSILTYLVESHFKNGGELRQYSRFDSLVQTIDKNFAQIILERLEGAPVPARKVIIKAKDYLEDFILTRKNKLK